MISLFSRWEIGLASAIMLIAVAEYVGLILARRRKLTTNVSRLVTHGLIVMICLLFVGFTLSWSEPADAFDSGKFMLGGLTANWTFLLISCLIGLVAFELAAHTLALRFGLTTGMMRLVSHLAMAILLLVMVGINLAKWQLFLDEIAAGYAEAIPETSAADADPGH